MDECTNASILFTKMILTSSTWISFEIRADPLNSALSKLHYVHIYRVLAFNVQSSVQWTTYLAATYKAETTGFADQNPLTTQFYLLLAESPL